jgi:hypothetical protein
VSPSRTGIRAVVQNALSLLHLRQKQPQFRLLKKLTLQKECVRSLVKSTRHVAQRVPPCVGSQDNSSAHSSVPLVVSVLVEHSLTVPPESVSQNAPQLPHLLPPRLQNSARWSLTLDHVGEACGGTISMQLAVAVRFSSMADVEAMTINSRLSKSVNKPAEHLK